MATIRSQPLIELHAAQRDELETIENLMQFYMYDFSEWLPLKLGEHGFFNAPAQTGLLAQPRNPAISDQGRRRIGRLRDRG